MECKVVSIVHSVQRKSTWIVSTALISLMNNKLYYNILCCDVSILNLEFLISKKMYTNATIKQLLLKNEDIFLLLVSHCRIKCAVTKVNRRLFIVRCGVVPCILVEGQLSLFQHTIYVHPGLAVKSELDIKWILTDYNSGHNLGQIDVTLLKLLFFASTIINIIWHSRYEAVSPCYCFYDYCAFCEITMKAVADILIEFFIISKTLEYFFWT